MPRRSATARASLAAGRATTIEAIFGVRRPPIGPGAQRHADHPKPIAHQEGGGNGGVHTPAHRDGDRLGGAHAALLAFPASSRAFGGCAPRSGETVSATYSMSRDEVHRPRENRTELRACSGESPMARSTWDGSTAPELHAAPDDTPIPCRSKASTTDSASAPGKARLLICGRRLCRMAVPQGSSPGHHQRRFQPVSEPCDAATRLFQVRVRSVAARPGRPHPPRSRCPAARPLLPSAVDQGDHGHPPSDVEGTDPFGAVDLVS